MTKTVVRQTGVTSHLPPLHYPASSLTIMRFPNKNIAIKLVNIMLLYLSLYLLYVWLSVEREGRDCGEA